MATRFHLALGLATLSACMMVSRAQTGVPVGSGQADHSEAMHVTLGESAIPLYGPWRFSIGDSPIDSSTNKPLWAEPDFDDSHWETVDLTPAEGSFEPIQGTPGFVPGWTTKGHPGYWGYGWYRLRVKVEVPATGASQGGDYRLALEGPTNYDTVYQVFADGNLLGGFGDFSGRTPVEYYNVPELYPLAWSDGRPSDEKANDRPETNQPDQKQPDQNHPGLDQPGQDQPSGQITRVLAFRVWMGPGTLANEPQAGGLHDPPLLGEAAVVSADYQLRWLDLVRAISPTVFSGLFHLFLALVAFSLVLFDRKDRVYLWIGAVFLLQAIYALIGGVGSWTQDLSITADGLLGDCLTFSLIMAGWVMVWWVWFGRRPRWIPRAALALVVVWIVARAIATELIFGLVPHPVANQFVVVTLVIRLLFFALMLVVVMRGIQTQGVEGWLVLPAILLRAIGVFSGELRLLGLRVSLHWLGANITLSLVATLLMALSVALLLLRRLLQSVRAQRLMALDVKQAQEVQQVILPEALVTVSGITIESVYRPAREVGGDFFQIIPAETDGSLLVVAGDVAGKGLQAGMRVALLVGAIRTVARFDTNPTVVLRELNQRLIGRSDAAATCLAMRITADGVVTLANAGHLPPYLNGEPVAMEGALPLGMIPGAECSVMQFTLKIDDRLVIASDGIVEATDPHGTLFGFERMAALAIQRASAAEIADAAQTFGQEDDISVVSLTRTAMPELIAN